MNTTWATSRRPGWSGTASARSTAQSRPVEQATLLSLAGLMGSSAPLPGRKLVFFISDGFVVDARKSNATDLLRRVTDEAARVGAVVYTMDPRGVLNEPAVSAGRNDYADFSQRVVGRGFFDAKTTQEPLLTLAAETGGRAFINTNSLNDAFAEAAREASRYYLLAWRPDTEAQRSGKSRVEVRVLGGDRAALNMPHGRPAPVSGTDPRRLAFSGDFGLEQLPAGRYVLQISAADPRTKAGVVREVSLVVE